MKLTHRQLTFPNPMNRILAALYLLACAVFAADEKPAPPQNFTYRITGLFSPGRETALRTGLEKLPDVKLVSVDFAHAEAVFSYVPAVAFKGTKPDDITKRFDELLRNATHSTLGIAPLITTPHDTLTRIEIPVIGLDCQACALATYEAIYKIDGVTAATVDYKEGRVTALIDVGKTTQPALEATLKKREIKLKTPPKTP